MITRGIRGATTVKLNSKDEITTASLELFNTMVSQNEIEYQDISHIIISATSDISKVYPAEAIRTNNAIKLVPILCVAEMQIENSLEKCIRFLVVVNTEKAQDEIKHIYLNDAKSLRKDLLED